MKTSTGAYSDFQAVRQIAWSMITEFGFNQHLGQMSWASQNTSVEKTNEIDAEVLYLVERAHMSATNMMMANEAYLHKIANALLEKNILSDDDLRSVLNGIVCGINDNKKENQ
jgi:cell division protease FtsH